MDIKTSALLEVVKAYLNRGNKIQYDQRCMDRKLITTPRRDKYVSPETATNQRTVFLDCSSFVNIVFWETFGIELPFELTWHMVDYIEPRVFLYTRTYEETDDEIEEIKNKIKDTLKVGDVITFDRISGSGHTVIYMGDDKVAHCTTNGRPNSYDYEEKKSREYDDGGLFVLSLEYLINNSIFESKTIKRIAIERPLEIMGEPTAKTMARLYEAKDLICGVEVSHAGGHHAVKGETITYSVKVFNNSKEDRIITVSFIAPECTSLKSDNEKIVNISFGQEMTLDFEVTLETDEEIFINEPKITVNGLLVTAPKVLIGKAIHSDILSKVSENAVAGIKNGKTAVQAASDAYKEAGITFSPVEKEHFYKAFYIHDTLSGDVLSRRAQIPTETMGVYSFFGGVAVITPEKISYPYVRKSKVSRRDLMEGDLILLCDDNFGQKIYSSYYNGEELCGIFEYGGKIKSIKGEDLDRFIDSLLGQYSFIILRPSYLS